MSSIVYTDGSCLSNPGPGGWCFCIVKEEYDEIDSGGELYTTNNRMELIAIIQALKYLTELEIKSCTIHSDSQLTINCCKKMWKRKSNLDLWEEWDHVSLGFEKINLEWVKAHNGNKYNEIVDKEARSEANRYKSMMGS